jgi:hypothetical protein
VSQPRAGQQAIKEGRGLRLLRLSRQQHQQGGSEHYRVAALRLASGLLTCAAHRQHYRLGGAVQHDDVGQYAPCSTSAEGQAEGLWCSPVMGSQCRPSLK